MKGMKGKLLKKLKSIKSIGYLKPDRVLHVSALDGYIYTSPSKSASKVQTHLVFEEEESNKIVQSTVPVQEPEVIDVSELMRDLEDEELEFDEDINDKENIRPETISKNPVVWKDDNREILSLSKPQPGNLEAPELRESRGGERKHGPLSEIDISSFRGPDLDSGTLFDPNLLAAFEQAVMEVKAEEAERRAKIEEKIRRSIEEEPPLKARKIEESTNPLLDFEENCPPGGDDSVILYTTGLRGIRKTFEDCHSVKFLLESFRVLYYERDVSMHLEFKEEMWRILGGKVVPPRLFIKGRYIGGAEEVLRLHEQGKLRPLFEGVPIDQSEGPCEGCAGIRFVMCFNCNGSQKIVLGGDGEAMKCPECNENGLIKCPICC
ncbi:unnamed protein product [Ilex paraguariensis]|uniref:Glutaredoxin domain-containing protein n=1 Tax=Ilex paraguariensis TaxID=185542 RepID=A0ABC8TDN3_9AQUA